MPGKVRHRQLVNRPGCFLYNNNTTPPCLPACLIAKNNFSSFHLLLNPELYFEELQKFILQRVKHKLTKIKCSFPPLADVFCQQNVAEHC